MSVRHQNFYRVFRGSDAQAPPRPQHPHPQPVRPPSPLSAPSQVLLWTRNDARGGDAATTTSSTTQRIASIETRLFRFDRKQLLVHKCSFNTRTTAGTSMHCGSRSDSDEDEAGACTQLEGIDVDYQTTLRGTRLKTLTDLKQNACIFVRQVQEYKGKHKTEYKEAKNVPLPYDWKKILQAFLVSARLFQNSASDVAELINKTVSEVLANSIFEADTQVQDGSISQQAPQEPEKEQIVGNAVILENDQTRTYWILLFSPQKSTRTKRYAWVKKSEYILRHHDEKLCQKKQKTCDEM
jgi:hypothetical protein